MILSPSRPRLGLATLFFGLALGACSEASPPKPDPSAAPAKADVATTKAEAGAAKAGDKRSFGAALGPQTERITLSDLVREPSRYADKTVRVSGKVSAVCQSQGCWLELGDEAGSAHVKLKGHSFFVPKDASGKRAEVEARVFPAVDKGHCEQEAEEQTGRLAKVELEATGVELF